MSTVLVVREIQRLIYAALLADPDFLAACGGRLYEHVPQGSVYPLAVLECTSTEGGDKSLPGEVVTIEVNGYSQYHGFAEVDTIAEAAVALLDRAPTVASGPNVYTAAMSFKNIGRFRESDGVTSRIVARFTAYSQPTIC
jgi:hypothetical protein